MIRGVGFHLSVMVALRLVVLLVMWLSSLCVLTSSKIYAHFVRFAGAADHHCQENLCARHQRRKGWYWGISTKRQQ